MGVNARCVFVHLLTFAPGFMDVEMTFREPFFGIVYADFDRNSACKITGNGKFQETIKLPLKGCGTLQVCGKNARFPDANAN